MKLQFILNGSEITTQISEGERLIDLLRKNLKLTGTKESCSEGRCGSCSVIVDNVLVLACIYPAARLEGKKVTTIEGLGNDGKLNYVQQAFVDVDAIQCGYCTPGMIMNLTNYYDNGGVYDLELIKKMLAGNLCRCTGYTKIFEAAKLAFEYKNR